MNPNPYFSVIIPTLNEEKFLPTLLTDLSKQTFTDFEVIVVDAKSKDKTKQVAETFHPQLPALTLLDSSKKNVSFQRNLGASKAHGKIFLFIDADTGLPPFFLDGIKYRLSKKPADIFTTWLKPDSKNPQDAAITAITNLSFEIGRLIDLPAGMGSMLGFKRSVFKQLQGFDNAIGYAEDQEIIRRAIEQGYKFIVYSDPQFTWSFRRFRQQGTLESIRKFVKAQSKIIANGYLANTQEDYPMGGHNYISTRPKLTFTQKLKQLFTPHAKTPSQ